jgi:hypothetical protein
MKIIYFDTVSSQIPRETTLELLAKSLRSSDLLRRRTEDYRAALAEDKDRAAQLKKGFQGFLPAAIVSEKRARKYVTALTGLVMCDFDHVPLDRLADIRAKVNADPHTVLSYVTLSGEGLRVLAKYSRDELDTEMEDQMNNCPEEKREGLKLTYVENFYRKMFKAINQYYAQLIDCEFDPACKDLSRLSFVAFDEEAYYQPEATEFTAKDCNVSTWELRKQKKAEKRNNNRNMHLIAHTYKRQIQPILKQEGVVYGPGTHNNYVMRVGYAMNKFGFEAEKVMAWASEEFADYKEAAEIIKYCYNKAEEHGIWSDKLDKRKEDPDGRKRQPTATRIEIFDFVKDKMDIRYNLITGYTEIRWKNPAYEGIASPHSKDRHAFTFDTDRMIRSIALLMEQERGLDAAREKIYDVIENDFVVEFDPLLQFLTSLRPWNPDTDPDYLQQLADTVTVSDPDPGAQALWARCLKKWFVGMLVGWTNVHEMNQTILHLVGRQGTYKSTWMRNLMPPELHEYFKIKQNSGEIRTDDIISMSRYGLILHEEADVMNPTQSNTLKAMSTASHSDERAPYGRAPRRRNNIASLCATGNNEQFLNNEQGTRRELVFRVGSIVSPIDHPFNHEGIYAQAYYLMTHGFQYYFDSEEQAELERHNRQFETVNHIEEAIDLYVRKPVPGEICLWMRPSQIAEELTSRSSGHMRFDANKVGLTMRKMGFVRTYRHGNAGYKVVVRTYEEAQRYQKELALQEESMEDEKEIECIDL